MKATCAEKNEVSRKNRLLEGRIESSLEIIVMLLSEDSDELKNIMGNIVKGSKKLRNSNLLLNHLKSQLDLSKKLTKVETEDGGEMVEALDMKNTQPTLNLNVNRRPKRSESNRSGLGVKSLKLEGEK